MICMPASNGEELREIRKRIGMSMTTFAERIGVKRSTYKNWEYGVVEDIPDEYLVKARKLDKPEVSGFKIPAAQLLIPIPYLGTIAACDEVHWSDPFESVEFEYVPPEMGEHRGRFAIRISGDSMYDLLLPGDLCVFQQSDIPKIGHVVLFRAFDQRVTVKTLRYDGAKYLLEPENKHYEVAEAKGSMVGYLVGIVRVQGSRKVTVYDEYGIRS